MPGFGTIINVAAILAGGLAGLFCKRLLSERIQDTLMKVCGIITLFIALSGAMEKMLSFSGDVLVSKGTMVVIVSLVLGALLGECLNLEDRFERFGEWLKRKTGNAKDTRFVEGFVTASLTVCIGAMAIVGAIQDGIMGDYSVLAAKAVLDMVIVMVMTCSLGKGCIFSAIPVGCFQGGITVLARLIEPLMTKAALGNLSLLGSVLIFCVGVNLVWGKTIRVANLLPSLVAAAALAYTPISL